VCERQKTVGKVLATNRTCLYSHQLFRQTHILPVNGWQTCVGDCQPIKTRALFAGFAWHFTRWQTDVKTNVQPFKWSTKFRIVQICWTFYLQGIMTQKTCRRSSWSSFVVPYTDHIFTDIRFRPNLFKIFRDKHKKGPRHKRQLFASASALCRPFCKFANLVCVVIWREFDMWTHQFANFFEVCQHEFANLSLPCEGCLTLPNGIHYRLLIDTIDRYPRWIPLIDFLVSTRLTSRSILGQHPDQYSVITRLTLDTLIVRRVSTDLYASIEN